MESSKITREQMLRKLDRKLLSQKVLEDAKELKEFYDRPSYFYSELEEIDLKHLLIAMFIELKNDISEIKSKLNLL